MPMYLSLPLLFLSSIYISLLLSVLFSFSLFLYLSLYLSTYLYLRLSIYLPYLSIDRCVHLVCFSILLIKECASSSILSLSLYQEIDSYIELILFSYTTYAGIQ